MEWSLLVHVVAGSLALLSGLGALFFRKRLGVHRRFGKVYLWCMTVVFVTALYVAAYKSNYFLLFIAIFSYHACLTAFRSLKLKQLHLGQKVPVTDWCIEGFNVMANLGLYGIAGVVGQKGYYDWALVCATFGTLGLRGSWANIQRFRGRVRGHNYWLLVHSGGMLGSYIGALTAFLVNNNRWMGLPDLLAWLGPSAVLVPFIFYELSALRKKTQAE